MAAIARSSSPSPLLGLALPAALVAVWEVLGRAGVVPQGILPAPSLVAATWWDWAVGPSGMGLNPYLGTWFETVLFSARRVFTGFAAAIALGVPLGIMIGWNRLVAGAFDPLIQSLRPIPITAWLPFSIAVFGIRDAGAVFLIGLGAFFPIVVNTTAGARDTPRNLIRAARMMGASERQLLLRVVLPNALPAIFTGMRLGLGIAWTAVIVAEIVAVKSGLGYVLWDAYYVGRMDVVIADMVSIGIAGFLSDRILVAIGHRVLHWKQFGAR
ncbi:ABC transporter permease [Elioraea rosea]|uniref:ABC transporter permease n=1 Tax=Elioraea rosea TaxID=2492390 RepID=UPI001182B2AE|nr:ABC transporter permease [Elioraea rosea]